MAAAVHSLTRSRSLFSNVLDCSVRCSPRGDASTAGVCACLFNIRPGMNSLHPDIQVFIEAMTVNTMEQKRRIDYA